MADADVDTITPIDPAASEASAPEVSVSNVDRADYTTQGRTEVATRRGYRFAPTDKSLPVITHVPIRVNAEQAADLEKASGGLVTVVSTENEEA